MVALDTLSKDPVLRKITKSASKNEFSISKPDRIIISAHAIFEGIGIAGLISAAFWYTTAPMAPDGFKGPISTFTITVTTIISLFLAIPIAKLALKKLMTDMEHLFSELTSEVRRYIYSYDELVYELFKIRSSCVNDEEFKKHLADELELDDILLSDSLINSVSSKYNQMKNTHFFINWNKPIKLVLSIKESGEDINLISFWELLSDRNLSTNTAIKKSLIQFMRQQFLDNEINFESVIEHTYRHTTKQGHIKNVLYGIASAVACSEVLLSIGWTVISILIGVNAIVPISNMYWGIFAVSCILSGSIFGLGMGLSRHKQKFYQLLHLGLKDKNNTLSNLREHLNNIFTQKSYVTKKIMTNIRAY